MNKEIILYVLRDYKRLLNPDCFEEYEDFEKMKEMADEAIEELSKSEKFSYQDEVIKGFDGFIGRYAKYNPKKSDISKVLPELVKASFRVPPFAGTCTKCGAPAEKPEYTLCKHHFDSWTNSKLTRTNYTHLVHIDSPKEVREYYHIGNIWANRGKCPKCGDVIQSFNHYDYVTCSCKHSFIDGGSDYSRRNPDLIDMSVSFNNI